MTRTFYIFAVLLMCSIWQLSAEEISPSETSALNLRSFGAIGDGKTDDTRAIQRWLDDFAEGQHGFVPAGTYLFTKSLFSLKSRISISGEGSYQTTFMYAGSTNVKDLIEIGDGKINVRNWELRGFRISSRTHLQSGSALRLRRVARSKFIDMTIDGQDGLGNLWDGIWFDGIDDVIFHDFDVRAQNVAVAVNGTIGKGPKADLFLTSGKIAGSGIGLLVAGGFGGLYADQVAIIANKRNVVVDTSRLQEGNRELFFGPTCAIDSSKEGFALTIADTLANREAWLQLNGTWIATGAKGGIIVMPGTKWIVALNGGTIFNFKEDGIRNESQDARLIVNGTLIRKNGGAGIATINTQSYANAGIFDQNKLGQVSHLTK